MAIHVPIPDKLHSWYPEQVSFKIPMKLNKKKYLFCGGVSLFTLLQLLRMIPETSSRQEQERKSPDQSTYVFSLIGLNNRSTIRNQLPSEFWKTLIWKGYVDPKMSVKLQMRYVKHHEYLFPTDSGICIVKCVASSTKREEKLHSFRELTHL